MSSPLHASDQPHSDEKVLRTEVKLATFRVGTDLYAVDILRIKEIIRPIKVTTVPNSPPAIEGVINLRGAVIPVIDLRKRFAVATIVDGRATRMVICLVFRRLFALVVDEVVEVRSYGREELQSAPKFFQGQETDIFLGVAHRGDDLLLILDLERFLSLSRMADFIPPPSAVADRPALPLS
ncbi:MAG: chemotaxis protein CheW [Desulfuromonadales bacterium]|nr:chemotaxis protein CheW [Desulfuromonadales bacterium]